MSLEEIADYIPSLLLEELKELLNFFSVAFFKKCSLNDKWAFLDSWFSKMTIFLILFRENRKRATVMLCFYLNNNLFGYFHFKGFCFITSCSKNFFVLLIHYLDSQSAGLCFRINFLSQCAIDRVIVCWPVSPIFLAGISGSCPTESTASAEL